MKFIRGKNCIINISNIVSIDIESIFGKPYTVTATMVSGREKEIDSTDTIDDAVKILNDIHSKIEEPSVPFRLDKDLFC